MASDHQAKVEDASSSPSPLAPTTTLPTATATAVDDDDDGTSQKERAEPVVENDDPADSVRQEEEEWDPASEKLPGQEDSKGKGKSEGGEKTQDGNQAQPWQAVWAPEQNAWYFWNTKTSEVSWTNPLEPQPSNSEASSSAHPPLPNEAPPLPSGPALAPVSVPATSDYPNAFEAPSADPYHPEIDEGLLHIVGGSRAGSAIDPTMQSASFNARTGRFTPGDYQYTVGHLDEYNRAKRMNSHYFDVDAWEKERAAENEKRKREEESGQGSKKKISKKDMQRFRQKAAEKKARSQAWLRE